MPVDGKLRSRRPITGRALGTSGFVVGSFIEVDDLLDNAPAGGSGKITLFKTPTIELKDNNIDTEIALM